MKPVKPIALLRSPERVLSLLIDEYKSSTNIELSDYLSSDLIAVGDNSQMLTAFVNSIEDMTVIHRIPCECKVHYWLEIQLYDDAEDIMHAQIRFQRESSGWKIDDVRLQMEHIETQEQAMASILGRTYESDNITAHTIDN